MQNLVNRVLDAIVGFLLAAFKSNDANKPLPPPAPFPVGTPPTPAPTPTPPPTPQPTANPLVVRLAAFVGKWNTRYIPPKFGGAYQCVALVNEYTSEVFNVYWPRLSAAGDFVGYRVPGFVFIANTPTNVPSPGDIVEWGRSPNLPWGHIGVFLTGDSMHLNTFDQNWPLGSPAHTQAHTYAGVSGWHHKI